MPAHEYPVSDAHMDALADAALGPDPELDLEPIQDLKEGSDHDKGRAASDRELARRQRLLLSCPNVRDALSARRKKAFLSALAQTGRIGASAAAAGWSKGIPASLRKADKEFSQQWDWAMDAYVERLEAAAELRAVDGVQKGVYGSLGKDQGSGLIGTETVYSDNLLMFLIKANARAKYGDKSEVDVTSKGGVLVVPAAPSQSDWEAQASQGQRKFREGDTE